MIDKIYYKDNYSVLAINDKIPCLYQKLIGLAQSSDHYKMIQDISIKLASENAGYFKNLNLLIDSSEAGSITLDDIDYHRNQVIPELYKKGMRFIAYVPPQKKISRIIFNEIFTNLKFDNLIVRHCGSSHGAKRWLSNIVKNAAHEYNYN